MGNYSIRNIFAKEPVVIAGAIKSVLWVFVILGLVVLDEKQLAGIALSLELLLGLFARTASTSTTFPTLEAGTKLTVVTPDGQPNRTETVR